MPSAISGAPRANIHAPAAFVVRAPATCANLGPGFDCLGLALDLWNEVKAMPAEVTEVVSDEYALPDGAQNLVLLAAQRLAERCGRELPPLALRCVNRVPPSRGLGSSAAAIVSGLLLANRCLGEPLGTADLLALAAEMEGHADNVTPCLLGGVRVGVADSEHGVLQVPVALRMPLTVAAFVPEVTLSTEAARAVLPPAVPFEDALFNVGRVSLLVAALAAGEPGLLREATRDRLHQPYRATLFAPARRLIKDALDAGAYGAFVSGAGPTIVALCEPSRASRVHQALAARAAADGVPGSVLDLSITTTGAQVHDAV